jgi:hypothetical protein
MTNSTPKATARSSYNQIILVYYWTAQYAIKYVTREFRAEKVRVSSGRIIITPHFIRYSTVHQYFIRIASRQTASTATSATAKTYTAATATVKRIFWGAAFKATSSSMAALFLVLRRSIGTGFVEPIATMLLRTLVATAIAKLKTNTARENIRNNRNKLLLSVKLRGSSIGSRCVRSGEVMEGVTHISGDAGL